MRNKNWSKIEGPVYSLEGVHVDGVTNKYYRYYASIEHCIKSNYRYYDYINGNEFVTPKMKDDMGIFIPEHVIMNHFERVVAEYKANPFKYTRKLKGKKYNFRDGPVPHVRGGWSKRYRFLRRMKTTAERRENCKKYDGVKFSGRKRKLPELHDDIIRSVQRNWKKFRKTQYKNIGGSDSEL